MTDNTHTDNKAACRTCGASGPPWIHKPSPLDPKGIGNPGHKMGSASFYTPMDIAPGEHPTKSSGELEEVRKMVARYDSSKVTGIDSLAGEELIEGMASLLATQTTKLRAEARIDSIQLYMDTCEKEGVPPSWRNLREFQRGQKLALERLEREHKIGEDGE